MALIRLAVIVAVGLVLEPIAAEAQPAAKVGRIDYLTQTEDRRAPGADLEQKRRYRLEMRNGRGHGLCEGLFREARRLHPKAEYRALEPNLTWQAIFAIPGVAEPPWKELDPLQFETLFAKLYQLYEDQDNLNVHAFGNLNRVDLFFARGWYPCQICRLPLDERRRTTLEGYRDFAKNGGRMRAYVSDIGETGSPIPVALIQYEYIKPPAWGVIYSGWYGFTFYADSSRNDLFGFSKNFVDLGRYTRLVLYRGHPHVVTLENISITNVQYIPWPSWKCEILRREVEAQR